MHNNELDVQTKNVHTGDATSSQVSVASKTDGDYGTFLHFCFEEGKGVDLGHVERTGQKCRSSCI